MMGMSSERPSQRPENPCVRRRPAEGRRSGTRAARAAATAASAAATSKSARTSSAGRAPAVTGGGAGQLATSIAHVLARRCADDARQLGLALRGQRPAACRHRRGTCRLERGEGRVTTAAPSLRRTSAHHGGDLPQHHRLLGREAGIGGVPFGQRDRADRLEPDVRVGAGPRGSRRAGPGLGLADGGATVATQREGLLDDRLPLDAGDPALAGGLHLGSKVFGGDAEDGIPPRPCAADQRLARRCPVPRPPGVAGAPATARRSASAASSRSVSGACWSRPSITSASMRSRVGDAGESTS